jgi:hypothetical protein
MKRSGVKVVSPVGDTEVHDAYARTIRMARRLREKGESPDSSPPLRLSEDVNEGPPAEDQETISSVTAALGLSIPKSMYPRLPIAIGIAFSLIAEGKTEQDRFIPAMLGLSEKEAVDAAAAVVRVLLKYRPGSWWELVWCLAVRTSSLTSWSHATEADQGRARREIPLAVSGQRRPGRSASPRLPSTRRNRSRSRRVPRADRWAPRCPGATQKVNG